jgi:CheY-like chemotaxis protein
MIPEALLVCPHEDSSRLLRPELEKLGTRVECQNDAMAALTRLWNYRYDAIIVDCEGEGDEAEVVREVREAAQNKHAITIAVIGEQEDPELAYAMGAHFVLRKPLDGLRVRRMLRAAHSLILQERRRYERLACEGPATVICGAAEFPAYLVDISQGGVALRLERPPEASDVVRLRFRLPGTPTVFASAAEVKWHNDRGRAGLSFTAMTALDRSALLAWLAAEGEKPRPPRSRSLLR